MKTRILPLVAALSILAASNMLPAYASEKTANTSDISTEEITDITAGSMSRSLVELTTEGDALEVVRADIAAKEKAEKEAAEKAAREKAEKEAAEKAAAEKAAAEKAAAEKAAAEEAARQQAEAQAAAEREAAVASGRTMIMESTAYSSDPADLLGGGTVTALGQNLLANPMAVAVDPNVIPLGTRVYVEGYGEAIASDTGSAIIGNIIDVHFPTNAQCEVWGRRQVTVTILG